MPKNKSAAKSPKLPAPGIVMPGKIDIPPTTVHNLACGIPLYTVRAEGGDVARVSVVFEAGTARQSAGFVASSTANLLSEGTANYTAEQLAEKLDFYGLFYDVGIDRDSVVVTFCALNKFFPVMMELVAEVLLRPAFAPLEVETYCHKRKQQLLLERTKTSTKARELFSKSLFGDLHPYGISTPAEAYDTITREEIHKFYSRFYTAGNCFMVCSGLIEPDHIAQLTTLAGLLSKNRCIYIPDAVIPTPAPVLFAFEPHPGALQSAIRVGKLLFKRTHPDFIAMQMVSTILGGYFGSRLIKNLREEHGYTYGIFAGMVTLQHAGYIAIATEVATEVTPDAIAQILHEVERMSTQIVSHEELDLVKNIVVGEVMRIIDGPFGIADITIENIQNGVDNSYLDKFLSEIRDMTPEKVQQTAQKYLRPDTLTITVVADPKVKPELEAIYNRN